MRISAAIEGRLTEHMAREAGIVSTGLLEAVAKQTLETKLSVRSIINAAFTGSAVVGRSGNRRVANAIRGKLFEDEGDARGSPVGVVYSRFGRKQGGKFLDYLLPHALGATISPTNARRLYIPLQPGLRGPLARRARASFKLDPTIAIIPASPGVWVVVRRRRGAKGRGEEAQGTAIGLLVNRVRLPKRFSLDQVERRIVEELPARALEEMRKADRDLRYDRATLSSRSDGRGGAGIRRGRRSKDI